MHATFPNTYANATKESAQSEANPECALVVTTEANQPPATKANDAARTPSSPKLYPPTSFSGPDPFYTTFVPYMVLVVFCRILWLLLAFFIHAHSLAAKLLSPPVFLGYDSV